MPESKQDEADVGASLSKDMSELVDENQIVGRKIWRIAPYVTRYWKKALGGILANAGARAFDLIPFIAIGMAADYYQSETFTNSRIEGIVKWGLIPDICLLYTSPSPRD